MDGQTGTFLTRANVRTPGYIIIIPVKNLPVIASVNSRLHADVALIRLRHARINCRHISVLFPADSMPNAVGCWLPVAEKSGLRVGPQVISCAGQLLKQLDARMEGHDDGREVADLLIQAGVDAMGAHILADRLDQGHILICVHADNEAETKAAYGVFRKAAADTIIVGAKPRARAAKPAREIPLIAPWLAFASA